MSSLKREAKKLHISVNSLILRLIASGLGVTKEARRPKYHDLDHLAGTWSSRDVKEFQKNTQAFETIDRDIW